MIADDIDAIPAGIRKLNNDKIVAEAEAAKRAAEECKPASLPDTKNLFPEQGAPFRGFFVTEDGDIRPFDMPEEQAAIFGTPLGGSTTVKATMGGYSVSNEHAPNGPEAWADWLDTQEGNDPALQAANRVSNRFTFWGYRGEDPDGQ